jgi:hypothetical protein
MGDSIPVTGLEELEKHLQQLVRIPETPLDTKLFDEVELQLTGKLCLDVYSLSARAKSPSCVGVCKLSKDV